MTKKRSAIILFVLYILATLLLFAFEAGLCLLYKHPSRMPITVEINYEEDYEGTATLFTAMRPEELFSTPETAEIKNGKAVFYPFYVHTFYALSPNSELMPMRVKTIDYKLFGLTAFTIDAENYMLYRGEVLNIHNTADQRDPDLDEDVDVDLFINLEPYGEENFFKIDPKIYTDIETGCHHIVFLYFLMGAAAQLLLQSVAFLLTRKFSRNNTGKRSKFLIIFGSISTLICVLATIIAYVTDYMQKHFADVPVGQILYHIHTPLNGMGTESFTKPVLIMVGICIGVMVITIVLPAIFGKNMKKRYFFYPLIQLLTGVMVVLGSGYLLVDHFDLKNYWTYIHENSTIYDDYFADPNEVDLVFPNRDRNLIYVYLESMEVTFSDTDNGGNMLTNYIPNLTNIAEENYCFNGDTGILNGAHHINGATFTMGALVAQTGGAPINEMLVDNKTLNDTWADENNYLPGLTNLGDILATRGYNQEFLIGSNGDFAGRSSYFRGHGNFTIFDYYTAIERDYIPEDYFVWWGYEDYRLFEYAKTEITNMANQDSPFNMTMLTVDTHFTDGCFCDMCQNTYPLQYANVISCSDSQVAAFVSWIMEQDFYENTTIIISGDHLTSDTGFINNTSSAGFNRRTYVAVINPADNVTLLNNDYRVYTTLDMFPTTVAALGIEIPGDRLGLGVNLFSDTPTLAEQMGYETLNSELLKNSDYYTEHLLYGN